MFEFLKRGLEYNKLATAFTKLYTAIGSIEHEHEMSIGDDDEKLTEELTVLAVWVRENILEVLTQRNISLDEIILVRDLGGWKTIRHFMNITVDKMIKLSVDAGEADKIQAILKGGKVFYEAKRYLKGKYRT